MENIIYYQPAGERDKTLTVFHPEEGELPYPFVLVTIGDGLRSSMYTTFVNEMLSRGYAVVLLSGSGYYDEGLCAWAWLEANAAAYGLDIDRSLIFNHQFGVIGSLIGMADESFWAAHMEGCSSPMPSKVHLKGVATYQAFFQVPEVTFRMIFNAQDTLGANSKLQEYVGWISWLNNMKTYDDWAQLIDRLTPLIYSGEWRTSVELEDWEKYLCSIAPLSHLAGPKSVKDMPAFLVIHGEKADMGDVALPTEEPRAFVDALVNAGVSADLVWLPGIGYWEITSATSDAPAKIANEIDAWAQNLFAGAD